MKSLITISMSGLLLFALIVSALPAQAQEAPSWQNHAYITEAMTRERAIVTRMPEVPEEGIKQGVSDIFITKVEINPGGNVITIKVKPETDDLIKKSLAAAISQWKFKMHAPQNYPNGLTTLGRLTFQYREKDGKGGIELYEPPPETEMTKRLDYMHSGIEGADWDTWETIYPRPIKR